MTSHLSLGKCIAIFSTIAILFTLNSVVFSQDIRTWRDMTGKFSVEATLVEFDGENVKLKKTEDNRIVTLPLEKLSFSDQSYLRRQQRDEVGNPFAGGEPSGQSTGKTGSTDSTTTGDTGNIRRGDAKDANKVVVGVVSGWNYNSEKITPDGKEGDYQPCPISEESGAGYLEMLDIVKGTDATVAVTSYDNHQTDSTSACLMNMSTGKTMSHKFKDKTQVWGLSPDGKRVMVTPKDYQDKVGKSRLDFYTISDKGLTRTSSLIPYPDGKNDFNRYVEWATWVSPTHVLTTNNEETLRLWDMKTGKAVYQMTIGTKDVTLSHDRKVMVVPSRSGVFLCDVMTGKTLGKLSSAPASSADFDFSPDNTRLLGVMHKPPKSLSQVDLETELRNKVVHIWDLNTGKKLNEWVLNSEPTAPHWVDNRMIMKSNTLYDSESGVPVCYYEGGFNRGKTFNGIYSYLLMVGINEYILASAKLPQKAVYDAVEKVDVKKHFALYPGAEVSLKIETDGSADEKDIRKYIEQNLTDCGFVVKNSAKVQFVASVKKSAEGTETYRGNSGPFPMSPLLDRGGPQVDVKITAHESVLSISVGGKEFWKLGVVAVPASIPLDKDRSIQEVADELCKPDLEFFARTQLPR